MKYLIVSYKSTEEKRKIEDKGLFCYDLRTNDDGDKIATIEKNVVVNRIGSIITDEKLEFDKESNNYIDFNNFILENHEVDTIDELLEQKIKTRQLDNGMYVIDIGYRNKQPIALVERTYMYKNKKHKEYIIGFNYKIKDNKIEWGYGYYYSENIEKAKVDFNRVLNGESLVDTFSNENKKKAFENIDINETLNNIKENLKSKMFDELKIMYIFNKENICEKDSFAVVSNENDLIKVDLETFDIYYYSELTYNTDDDIFKYLEENYNIVFMDEVAHYNIWCSIDNLGTSEFEHNEGMQKYMEYCKKNDITKEFIDKIVGLDVPDIMQYSNEKKDIIKKKRVLGGDR